MDKGKDKITAKQERERQLSAEEERARAAEAAAAETGRMRQEAAREGIGLCRYPLYDAPNPEYTRSVPHQPVSFDTTVCPGVIIHQSINNFSSAVVPRCSLPEGAGFPEMLTAGVAGWHCRAKAAAIGSHRAGELFL